MLNVLVQPRLFEKSDIKSLDMSGLMDSYVSLGLFCA